MAKKVLAYKVRYTYKQMPKDLDSRGCCIMTSDKGWPTPSSIRKAIRKDIREVEGTSAMLSIRIRLVRYMGDITIG